MTKLAVAAHVMAGTVALIAGVVAMCSRKGGRLHGAAGKTFVVAMLVMAVLADYLAVVIPAQIPNLLIGTLTIYLVVTAWLTVRRGGRSVGMPEKAALVVILLILLPLAVLSFQLATGLEPAFRSAVPLRGPVLIAIYSFAVLAAVAAIGDARLVLSGGITGRRRIARHLWRMCAGLTFAAGSAFTNGLPRLLPRSVDVPVGYLFVPQLLVLGAMILWMIRVRFTGWYKGAAASYLRG
jgi:uncharacterized membrane protein